ncbi:hypothetical protein EDD11_003104 [Mortierella claussenii]|nr:hypothetical protein EDD11_003104 [Mortierella claussenii]
MVDTTQSPLAMLVLVTPYTILYLVNQLFLHGVLDRMHYIFFELIFVLAFRKVFGMPDLSEKLFPAQIPVQSTATIRPVKTTLVNNTSSSSSNNKSASAKMKTAKLSSGALISVVKKQQQKKAHPYAQELVAMEKKFMNYVENTEIWEKVFEETSPSLIEVYQYKARPMCYKIIAVMDNTAAVAFDLLSEVSRRVDWDPLCVEAKTVTSISPGVKIQYVRTKGVWPTASRDTLVLGTVKQLGEGIFCNVTSSVEHPLMPERTKEKFVRMETAVAGQIVGPEPGQPNKCRLVQVLDADLKGWIPEKVIQLVSTKAVPEGMRNLNKLLPSLKPYTESKTLERVARELQAAAAAAASEEDGTDDQTEDETVVEESTHELSSQRSSAMLPVSSKISDKHTNGHGKVYNNQGTIERQRSSTFRVFWQSLKQSLGFGGAKTSKILVVTLILAVLGPAIARLRRRR